MVPADEAFDGTWPYEAHFFEGNGFRQHYVDVARTDGAIAVDTVGGTDNVIVCLHGEPTWGYLYRNLIPQLSQAGRVIVPDHMGFGKSETPQDRDYSIREHSDNLERLLLDLDLRNITLVMQDWGGAIGTSFAVRHPDRIKCLCICNTHAPWARQPDGPFPSPGHHWVRWARGDQFEPTISNLGATVLSVMKRIGFERTDHVDETWVRAYASPFPTPESCRGALAFPRAIADPKTRDFFEELAETHNVDVLKAIPAMCIHGEADRAIPVGHAVFRFKSLWPDGPVVTLPGVGHFLQEDAPETVAALVAQFVQINNPSGTDLSAQGRAWNETNRWAEDKA